jgi:hypothetical protein
VLTLTRELTATATTPYDRAVAIERYLRTYSYTLDLPAPPADRDVVDYFLFDLKKGYCDYYAASMVVLARAAGLPARLVIGYASGTYDEENARTIITEANAHSWVEIYFPNYGWVEFEPTAGRPAIERPDDAPWPEIPQEWATIEAGEGYPNLLSTIGRIWWLGVVLLMLGSIAWYLIDEWRLRRLSPVAAGVAIYQRLVRHGRRLRVPTQAGDTPHEFATSMLERTAELARERRWNGAMIPVIQEVRWLTSLHVQTTYSPRSPDRSTQARAIQTWRQLRWRLWLAWVWAQTN